MPATVFHRAVAVLAALLAAGATACGPDPAGLGAACDAHADCDDALQCLDGLCTARCGFHVECGDGRRCDDGRCEAVTAEAGAACAREIDCGPGLRCALEDQGTQLTDPLSARCVPAPEGGAALAAACGVDGDCQNGVCALGACAELCTAAADCRPDATCAVLPRPELVDAPRFLACLPASGVIEHELPVAGASPTVLVPVPSTARSFALIASVDDPQQVVGASEVVDPVGRLLYRTPDTPEQFYQNPIRHLPSAGIATVLVPGPPGAALLAGVYRARLAVSFGPGQPSPTPPRARVVYRVDDRARLDLDFVFLDLADHPCADAWGGGPLDAAAAQGGEAWQAHVEALRAIFAPAGIELGRVGYRDLAGRADLASLEPDGRADLLAQATAPTGVTIFVVRSLAPIGLEAIYGQPAPPRTPGTGASGIAVAADALCYRDWPGFARITAHAMGRAMGLFRTVEPDGDPEHADPIDDTDGGPGNLMDFAGPGGTALTAGQAAVLLRYPGLR